MIINCGGNILDLNSPKIMGILNVNQDSFYAGSRIKSVETAMVKAQQMIKDGASIIDIGAMSSRPGAKLSDPSEEIEILAPYMEQLLTLPTIISIDTVWSKVAKHFIGKGVHMINDISAGEIDADMLFTISKYPHIGYVAMHMKGIPETMQLNTKYQNIILELMEYFSNKKRITSQLGIQNFIIDPGIGFSKTIEQNFEIAKKISYLKFLDLPILIGLSRKSFVYKTLEIDSGQALNGTTVINTLAINNGVNILRVHDVKEASQILKLYNQYILKV